MTKTKRITYWIIYVITMLIVVWFDAWMMIKQTMPTFARMAKYSQTTDLGVGFFACLAIAGSAGLILTGSLVLADYYWPTRNLYK